MTLAAMVGFVVEDTVRYNTTRKCLSGPGEDEEYEEIEWKEYDTCWGFYGELDKVEDFMLAEAGLHREELIEEIA